MSTGTTDVEGASAQIFLERCGARTADDTIDLLRRLAALYPDAKIAGILNRQGAQLLQGFRSRSIG